MLWESLIKAFKKAKKREKLNANLEKMLSTQLPNTEERKFASQKKSVKEEKATEPVLDKDNKDLTDISNISVVQNLLGMFKDAESLEPQTIYPFTLTQMLAITNTKLITLFDYIFIMRVNQAEPEQRYARNKFE